MISVLNNISNEEFHSQKLDKYHPIKEEIEIIAWQLEAPEGAMQNLLDSHEFARDCWLPTDIDKLKPMDAAEIVCRLQVNLSGERWIDGALSKAFGSGSLVQALERIEAELNQLIPE